MLDKIGFAENFEMLYFVFCFFKFFTELIVNNIFQEKLHSIFIKKKNLTQETHK